MLKIFTSVLVFSVSWLVTVTHAEAPVQEYKLPEPKTEWTKDEVKELVNIYADKYGVSRATLHFVVQCESGYRHDAVNWQDNHKLSKGSHGTAQFSRETFNHYKLAVNSDYNDMYNPEQALDVMGYMFSIKQANHWSCYHKFK